ncbi:LLM class F420-dependent oxidoreductase [Mycobacterium sp. M26]|uniref:LLM class F420-dependent oxidoreductase n=1 Tax=Mycobacterium sp. M26 TaxID=1762962 RepID=UPI00073F55A4|nr:LLM class F420-dependent oxidoreductase [Mycobacterium sp. M26]
MTRNDEDGKPGLGRFGVFGRVVSPGEAQEIESLGYGAIWVGNSPSTDLRWAEPMLEATTTLHVASGIVNIWTGAAEEVAESFHRIDAKYPGRFLLGIGVGHPEANKTYSKPLDALNRYLDTLDRHGVPQYRRAIAAIGPRLLKLAADRSAGPHPYLTTPQHTADARAIIGAEALLAPEHKVVRTADTGLARAIGRETLELYLQLKNATTNFARLGFTTDDIAIPGSDRLVDAFVAHGTAADIAAAVTKHLDAGADHVPIQVLGPPDGLIPALTDLAEPLGLKAGVPQWIS